MKNPALSKEQAFVAALHRDNDKTRKQLQSAMTQCAKGSANYLRYSVALNDLAASERSELIKLGLVPSDLSIATTTSYRYVSHVPGVFDSRDAALAAVAKRDKNMADGAFTSDEDELIRAELEATYGTSTTSNTATSSNQEQQGESNE
jgi:hypothetical protein